MITQTLIQKNKSMYVIYSIIIGFLLSIFFNSGKYFGNPYFYIVFGEKEIKITDIKFESIKSAGSDIILFPDGNNRYVNLDDVFEAYITDWDNVFYGYLTYVIIIGVWLVFLIFKDKLF